MSDHSAPAAAPSAIASRVAPTLLLLLGGLVVLAAGCGSESGYGPGDRVAEGQVRATIVAGLEQRVTLVPATLVDGRDVEVRSVLFNSGAAPMVVTSRICGLDYSGTLSLTHPPEVLKCAGYSAQGTLAPGDSVVSADLMRVSSPSGQYELRVRHALTPDHWVVMPVVVRAP
jgi:hypothetical protein